MRSWEPSGRARKFRGSRWGLSQAAGQCQGLEQKGTRTRSPRRSGRRVVQANEQDGPEDCEIRPEATATRRWRQAPKRRPYWLSWCPVQEKRSSDGQCETPSHKEPDTPVPKRRLLTPDSTSAGI